MNRAESGEYSVGVDFGTNSVRAVVVDLRDGKELASSSFGYPSGVDGVLVSDKDPRLARQHPGDYIEGFVSTVSEAVRLASSFAEFSPDRVVGIGIDSTGSTPMPVDADGMPLGMKRRFRRNLNAQAWLWKDHTAHEEAAAITEAASRFKVKYLTKCGGVYSSEWFWSKIWHCLRTDRAVFDAAYSWVELCDFIPAFITGNTDPLKMRRSICAAGHKAMFSGEWGGLPSKEFLAGLAPELAELRDRLYSQAVPSDWPAGTLTREMSALTGLPEGITVAVGAFDCHHGSVGCGVRPGVLVKTMGTSTCDVMVMRGGRGTRDIPGVCGVVPGSVVPGMLGIEAGQSAVGDIFKWYVDKLLPKDFCGDNPYAALEAEAGRLLPGESGLMALDWNNGNRTVLVNPMLSGMMLGLTLHTTAPEIYRALVEATAFGALVIIQRLEEYGSRVREVVACGGLAEKSPFMMQIYADALNRSIKISRSSQTCALGAAMFGAVAAGRFNGDVQEAEKVMTGVKDTVFRPDRRRAAVYARLFRIYRQLHDSFGVRGHRDDLSGVMKELMTISSEVRKTAAAGKRS